MDTTVTAVFDHLQKATGMPTLLNMVPRWGHSQVPVTCSPRSYNYLFVADSLLE